MLSYYPSHTHLLNQARRVNGQHAGILESQLMMVSHAEGTPTMKMLTGSMPGYHKFVNRNEKYMQYHLSGYGLYQEESLVRLLGEGIERYALTTAFLPLHKRFVKASYNDLKAESNVLPWEYLSVYSDQDYAKMDGIMKLRPLKPDDKISWMRCPSLFRPGEEVCIPVQWLFTGHYLPDEPLFSVGFSKGCAAHGDAKRALRAALLESLEGDAFTINWYAKRKVRRIVVDDPLVQTMLAELTEGLDVELVAYDYSLPDMPGHVFAVALLNTAGRRPGVLFGLANGMNPQHTLYRAVVEGAAIHYLGVNGAVITPEQSLSSVNIEGIADLDSNVNWWSNPDDIEFKQAFLKSMNEGEVKLSELPNYESDSVDKDLEYLIGEMGKVSQYGVYFDVTPADVADTGFRVVRVFFPELVAMAPPSFPYSNHPRLIQYGGVQNDLPHPSP